MTKAAMVEDVATPDELTKRMLSDCRDCLREHHRNLNQAENRLRASADFACATRGRREEPEDREPVNIPAKRVPYFSRQN